MRGALVGMIIILILLPTAGAVIPPVKPRISLQLSPTVMNVTSPAGNNVTITFNGTVTAQMMKFMRITVGFSSSVDKGWASSVSPNSMVITDEAPHEFTCDVTVPHGTPTTTATLTVDGTVEGWGTTHAIATINAIGSPSSNQTAYNQSGQNNTVIPPSQTESRQSIVGFNNPTLITASGAVLVVTVVGIVAFFYIKKRKTLQH